MCVVGGSLDEISLSVAKPESKSVHNIMCDTDHRAKFLDVNILEQFGSSHSLVAVILQKPNFVQTQVCNLDL